MPLPRFLYLHPDAKLSDAEIDSVYRWTKNERRRPSRLEAGSSLQYRKPAQQLLIRNERTNARPYSTDPQSLWP